MLEQFKYRLHRQRRPQRYKLLPPLLANQNLSQEQLLTKQQQAFSEIVRFAAGHTDYYKKNYAGLLSDDDTLITPTDLPILQKADVIAHRETMVADTIDKNTIRLGYTGGSTGTPVSFYYDDYKMELMRAGMTRSYLWSGWQPGEKILNFWGAKQDIKPMSLARRYKEFVAAEKTISAWEYGETELHQWVQFIKAWQPVLIQGYASIIADVARFIVDNGITMPASLKGVYSTAEVLYDPQRDIMQQAFHCKVTNQYGCREIPNLGLECSHGNMHIFNDMVNLESVNQDNEDKLIITSLTNTLMPMIRYENGDTGKLKAGQCPCGSPFPMMEMGMCRSNDFIKTKSGKKIAPSYFNRLLDGVEGINQYQFIQTSLDKLNLHINLQGNLKPDLQQNIQSKIHTDIDPAMQFNIIPTKAIKRTVSGKYRFVISEV